MKKIYILATLAVGAMSLSAQTIEQPKFFENWSVGVNGGVATPLKHNPFFKAMRPIVGVNVEKQVTPTFAVGAESYFGINTSSWDGVRHSSTAFDNSYVGIYGKVDLFNLFGGYQCATRPFTIQAVAGGGWGHEYYTKAEGSDQNFFATKAGLNFDFNVSDDVTISIQPSIAWNMTGGKWAQSTAAYSASGANFNILAGVSYHFGGRNFNCVMPYNQAEIDALNGEINALRAAVAGSDALAAASAAEAAALAAQLDSCMNRQPQVVKEVSNNLNSVRYVFFRIGSAVITADQQPNVEMIASYLKHHPEAKVLIKGYASKDGNYDFNIKLAQKRAEAVRTALINRYKVASDRIQAEGQGIGEMFKEESWNRVSICTIEDSDNK